MRTKAWENIQKKDKGVREFSIIRVGHRNDLTHLIPRASRRNMLYEDKRNPREVPIVLSDT